MSSTYFSIQEETILGQHVREHPGATIDGEDQALRLSVKKYVPRQAAGDEKVAITIIAAGGNGFPKELYEPLWDDLLLQSNSGSFSIRAIWTADMAHQGQSGILNSSVLGDDPSWIDHERDLLQMINHFRDDMSRPIVGIGHSIGATVLINLSLSHPRLLSHLILFEPILGDCTREGVFFAHFASQERDWWPSRSAAATFVRKAAPFNAWDPRVLQCWLDYGLRPQSGSNSGVVLATSKHQEAVTYVRPLFSDQKPELESTLRDQDGAVSDRDGRNCEVSGFECPVSAATMARLPGLKPSVIYVFGSKSIMSPAPKRQEVLFSTGTGAGGSGGYSSGKLESKLLSDRSHLVTFDDPVGCAAAAADYLCHYVKDVEKTGFQSFDRSTMQVTDAWRREARREVTSMLAAKATKL